MQGRGRDSSLFSTEMSPQTIDLHQVVGTPDDQNATQNTQNALSLPYNYYNVSGNDNSSWPGTVVSMYVLLQECYLGGAAV